MSKTAGAIPLRGKARGPVNKVTLPFIRTDKILLPPQLLTLIIGN